jgi:hypothetical protein
MRHRSTITKRRARWRHASWWLQCLLLVTAWNGPIPYCHSHGTLANTSSSLRGWLGEHLQTYHSDVSLFANQLFNWHFHVQLPSQPGSDPEDDSQRLPQSAPPVMASDANLFATGRVGSVAPEFSLADLQLSFGCSSASRPTSAQADDFYGAFAPTLAVPLRFGVMRC